MPMTPLPWGIQYGGVNSPGVRAHQLPPSSASMAGPATVGQMPWFAPQWGI